MRWSARPSPGHADYNNQQLADSAQPIPFFTYIATSEFVLNVAENWQSEFLAIGSMVVLGIYLRQRGSPESKSVGEPHVTTDRTG